VYWPAVQRKVVIGVESLPGCRGPTPTPVLSPLMLFWRQSFYFQQERKRSGNQGSPICKIRAAAKKGVWGESRLAFESIVEEVRRFVARMPPVYSTTGSACCSRSLSALGDQRAEILPVQRPPVLSAGGRCTMRLTRILMFPFFPLSILDQLPLHRGAFQNAQRTFLENWGGYT
jgi:hypothetical protein